MSAPLTLAKPPLIRVEVVPIKSGRHAAPAHQWYVDVNGLTIYTGRKDGMTVSYLRHLLGLGREYAARH